MGLDVVFAYEPDEEARNQYQNEFGIQPSAVLTGSRIRLDVPSFNLLFSRLPLTKEEFNQSVRPLVRTQMPVGVIFDGSEGNEDAEEIAHHVMERMQRLGYKSSFASLESQPYWHPGGMRHLLIVATARQQTNVDFPWDEVTVLATEYDAGAGPSRSAIGAASATSSSNSIAVPVAQATIKVMADLVRR